MAISPMHGYSIPGLQFLDRERREGDACEQGHSESEVTVHARAPAMMVGFQKRKRKRPVRDGGAFTCAIMSACDWPESGLIRRAPLQRRCHQGPVSSQAL